MTKAGRSEARDLVRQRFTIGAMAQAVEAVYARRDAAECGDRRRPLNRPRSGRRQPVTLLVISPDYASHLLPLATLATAWADAGERVVVATGPAVAPLVAEFGL